MINDMEKEPKHFKNDKSAIKYLNKRIIHKGVLIFYIAVMFSGAAFWAICKAFVMAIMFVALALGMLKFYSIRAKDLKSIIIGLKQSGLLIKAAEELSTIKQSKFVYGRVPMCTQNFLFNHIPNIILYYQEICICWSAPTGKYGEFELYVATKDNANLKVGTISPRVTSFEEYVSMLRRANPYIMIGKSPENVSKYNEMIIKND